MKLSRVLSLFEKKENNFFKEQVSNSSCKLPSFDVHVEFIKLISYISNCLLPKLASMQAH